MAGDDYTSWRGIHARHIDGREGRVTSDYVGFGERVITIRLEDGDEATIYLRTIGEDAGHEGWFWWCQNFDGGPRWLAYADDVKNPFSAFSEAQKAYLDALEPRDGLDNAWTYKVGRGTNLVSKSLCQAGIVDIDWNECLGNGYISLTEKGLIAKTLSTPPKAIMAKAGV